MLQGSLGLEEAGRNLGLAQAGPHLGQVQVQVQVRASRKVQESGLLRLKDLSQVCLNLCQCRHLCQSKIRLVSLAHLSQVGFVQASPIPIGLIATTGQQSKAPRTKAMWACA